MAENEESRHVREDYNDNMINDGRSSSGDEFDDCLGSPDVSNKHFELEHI